MSQQQGVSVTPSIIDTQATTVSEPTIQFVSETINEIEYIEKEKLIVDEKSITPVDQIIAYVPEPTVDKTKEPMCSAGTESVNGICKVIETDELQFCFLFW